MNSLAEKDNRIIIIDHKINLGVGQSIIDGYIKSSELDCDVTVVVGGDFQMDLSEAEKFIIPIIENKADYVKGNRFWMYKDELEKMPRIRMIGNTLISLLTKISSGYYSVFDVVDGYTAISKEAIDTVDWNKAWKGYGYPMDFLMRLNLYDFRVMDVPRKAVYLDDRRQSQIKGFRYFLKVSPMLLKNFIYRLTHKYLLRNVHPLVFMYFFSFVMFATGIPWTLYLLMVRIFRGGGSISGATAVFCTMLLVSAVQFFLFAMFFDIIEDKYGSNYRYNTQKK
jgi:hypothetical protein